MYFVYSLETFDWYDSYDKSYSFISLEAAQKAYNKLTAYGSRTAFADDGLLVVLYASNREYNDPSKIPSTKVINYYSKSCAR